MTIQITRLVHFEIPYTRDKNTILKALIDYLKKWNYSDAMIEALLYAKGIYSIKQINQFL